MFNLKIIDKFKQGPKSFKFGILLLCLGWALNYLVYYKYFMHDMPEKTLYLQLGVGVAMCLLVAAARPWARKMTLFFNIALVLLYTIPAASTFAVEEIKLINVLSILIIASISASTYFLFKKETGTFFILHDPKREESNSSDAEKT